MAQIVKTEVMQSRLFQRRKPAIVTYIGLDRFSPIGKAELRMPPDLIFKHGKCITI